MKRFIILFSAIAVVFFACGDGGEKVEKEDVPLKETNLKTGEKPGEKNESQDIKNSADYKKGLSLVAKSDCITCHAVDSKLIGPSYRDIANKYENTEENREMLAGKIIDGGKGVWGDVLMTPHKGLSKDDALTMVKYIMTLKNN
ncbi:MAG TPA: c-type cytochrome [Parasegetibacter sp.]|jgi:cytochrome c